MGLHSRSMMTSIYQYVLEELQASKGHWPTVAADSGVSRKTLEKIARMEIANPGVKSIEILAAYFQSRKGTQ